MDMIVCSFERPCDPVRLAAFDLDGTLLRGETVCEAIAKGIGRSQRMRELERLDSNQIEEVTAAREEMAEWYSSFSLEEVCKHLSSIRVAPGVEEGLTLLRNHGFKIAIVSITWEFAVEWFANGLGADYSVGTGLSPDGVIAHFWPQDKALSLTRLAGNLGVDMRDVAAVGDSSGDIPMLLAVGQSVLGWSDDSAGTRRRGRPWTLGRRRLGGPPNGEGLWTIDRRMHRPSTFLSALASASRTRLTLAKCRQFGSLEERRERIDTVAGMFHHGRAIATKRSGTLGLLGWTQ